MPDSTPEPPRRRGIGHRPSARGALPAPTRAPVELVGLNVRVPIGLRQRVKAAALADGETLQERVTRILDTTHPAE